MGVTQGRLSVGDNIPSRVVMTVAGDTQRLPFARGLTHLQFRRFAGCPICDLHLHAMAQHHGKLLAASVGQIVLFHSRPETLRPFVADLPFMVVADPGKKLYREFGVESGSRALTNLRVWPTIARGVWRSLRRNLAGRQPMPALVPEGGRFGLPADFLLDSDGQILAAHYGDHANDQWSVDDVLRQADAL